MRRKSVGEGAGRRRALRVAPALAAMAGALLAGGCAPAGGGVAESPGPRDTATAEAEVLAVVDALFDAMRAKDAEALAAVFHPEARLVTTGEREGRPVIRFAPAGDFVRGVSGAPGSLDETTFDPEVRIEDRLATVWTRYEFRLDGELSHCGVDAFQLFRDEEGWKIFQVADTRDPGCAGGS